MEAKWWHTLLRGRQMPHWIDPKNETLKYIVQSQFKQLFAGLLFKLCGHTGAHTSMCLCVCMCAHVCFVEHNEFFLFWNNLSNTQTWTMFYMKEKVKECMSFNATSFTWVKIITAHGCTLATNWRFFSILSRLLKVWD